MDKLDLYGKYFKVTFWLIVIVETLSFLGHDLLIVNQALFILITLATFVISLWRLDYGFWLAATELFIGSFGYLFYLDVGAFRLSIRLGIFLAVFAAWLIKSIKNKSWPFFHSKLFKPFLLLLAVLLMGVAIGLINGNINKNIFFDANAYLYFGLIFIAYSAINSWDKINKLLQILSASVLAVCLKTIGLLFYFSHQTDPDLLRMIYTWIRDTRVGEISPVVQNYYRIFFQSHIWSLFVFLIVFIFLLTLNKKDISRTNYRMLWLLGIASSLTLIISFSRSFWLGLAITLLLIFCYLVIKLKVAWKKLLKIVGIMVIAVILEVGLITLIVNVKLPGGHGHGLSAATLLKERITSTEEAAVGSRFKLLPPLFNKFSHQPIWGSGFGTTVSYQTLDPRSKEINGGWYTTYSFEWGYLDIMVKTGLIGLAVYLYFIWVIFRQGLQQLKLGSSPEIQWLAVGLLFSIIALLATHLTTPYLNHPLGIFLLIIASASFQALTKQSIPR